jgi:hypothetical protein
MSALEHAYRCVVDYAEYRLTFKIYSPRQLTADELRPLAIEKAIDEARYLGHTVTAAEVTPKGYTYEGSR